MKDLHAYCIMAHGNWEQLQMLINMLDDCRNDIYLHIDKKSLTSYNKWGVQLHFSHLVLTDSIDVRWSDYSQLLAEMKLFQRVIDSKVEYDRIHLISGADLPIKSQDFIHSFFRNNPREYISISNSEEFRLRLKYYHLFVRWRRTVWGANILRRILIAIQIPFVNRLKKCPLQFAYGANWCSLTLKATRFLCDNIDKYKHFFTFSTSCDEEYKQMILLSNNDFVFSEPVEGCLRYVDFSQNLPSPKTLTIDDFDKIKASNCLFARKFDINIDCQIVKKFQ